MEWLKKIFQGPTVVKSDLINSKLRQRHSLTKLNKQISNYNIHGAMLFTPSQTHAHQYTDYKTK